MSCGQRKHLDSDISIQELLQVNERLPQRVRRTPCSLKILGGGTGFDRIVYKKIYQSYLCVTLQNRDILQQPRAPFEEGVLWGLWGSIGPLLEVGVLISRISSLIV